jgi:hypothetical protein
VVMNRSRGYYRFRSVVRWIFWSSIVLLTELLLLLFVNVVRSLYGLEVG